MFFRRDEERRIQMRDYVQLTATQKLLLLRSLAWWLIRNGKSSAAPEEVHQRLQQDLAELNNCPPNATGAAVARLFIQRVAILRQFATGKIDFTHRTFQEFLAAQEAIAEADQQLVINNAEKEQWREVAILTAGLMENKTQAETFVMAILQRGDDEEKHTLYVIAAAALQLVLRLRGGSTLKTEVQRRLQKIIPPTSITAAQALADAGNLVVPLLKYDRRRKANETAASVRTLALVNSPEARSALADYLNDDRTTVVRELCNSLPYLGEDARESVAGPLFTAVLRSQGLNERTAPRIERLYLRAYPNTSLRHWHMACNLGIVLPRIARRWVDGRWISVKVSPDPRGLVGADRFGDPDLQNQL